MLMAVAVGGVSSGQRFHSLVTVHPATPVAGPSIADVISVC
jgi:hypothetical protein